MSGLDVAKTIKKVLTGWRLLFNEDAPNIVISKSGGLFSQPERMKCAWVTVWEREAETGKDLQLLIRKPSANGASGDNTWLSAPCE